jgi:hypothetical protein
MLPLPLVLDLVKMWALQQTLKKLRQYAADNRPDVQFDMPIVGQKVDIWVRSEPTPPPTAPKAKRAMEITVDGEKFWLFYLFQKAKK